MSARAYQSSPNGYLPASHFFTSPTQVVINRFQVITGRCIYTSGKSGYLTILDGYTIGKNLGDLDTALGSSSNSHSTSGVPGLIK